MALGLDPGTMFLVAARKSEDGDSFKTMRNCFLQINDEDLDMMKASTNSTIIDIDDEHFIVGDQAMGFSGLVADIRRPMADGILNPNEEESAVIISKLIEMVAGPANDGEVACVSIPAETADHKINPIHHRKIIKKIVEELGYTFLEINEALAVIYATNPKVTEDDGTEAAVSGIGVSMGGGMVNVCYAYRGKKQLQFSIARSGDWIDQQCSESMGHNPKGELQMGPARVAQFKEKYFSFSKDAEDYTDQELVELGFKKASQQKRFRRIHSTISSYYDNLISFILHSFVEEFKKSKLEVDYEMEVVISGGTSMPEGLAEHFHEMLEDHEDFPLTIKGVRRASDPLNSTALGALARSILEERNNG